MACMSNTRRTKRENRPKLTVVDEDAQPGAAEVADLQQALAAAGVPEELLRALDGTSDPEEVLRQLTEKVALPPDGLVDGLLESWRPLLEPRCDQLTAEITGYEFVGMVRTAAADEADVSGILTEMIEAGTGRGGPEALAMMRVLEVVGPEEVRATAAAAAERLVMARLTDPPWVAGLGRPEVVSCFGYTSGPGMQETLALTFRYGRRKHAVAVLIDHVLGGGVKDCWVTDHPERIRREYQHAARRFDMDFHDYDPAEARATLDRALAEEPCPVEADQIEDVRDHLELLRRRTALLPGGAVDPPQQPGGHAAGEPGVHKLKITLRGSKPPIWRRLEVPSNITLEELHHTIQTSFGWENVHLWAFDTPYGGFGPPTSDLGHRSATTSRLAQVAPRTGDRIFYTYDFGDGWEHLATVEDVLAPEAGVAYPRCVAGRRAGPPEDSGGMWGYAELLEILADPGHEEHADRLEWLGLESPAEFDPAAFDRATVNNALSAFAQVLVKAGGTHR